MFARIATVFVAAGMLAACSPQDAPKETPPPAAPAAAAESSAPKVGPVAPPTTEAEMLKSATSAAPEEVSRDATIVSMDAKMNMKTLKEGTNGWTCMPDGPSPGVDPMCLDKNGMEWAHAWMTHTAPPKDKMGFGYMLQGGSDASNTDPFATAPKEGGQWVDTGPHVMVLNIGDRFAGYPTTPDNTKRPYIMFPNTPYAHLMIPVK